MGKVITGSTGNLICSEGSIIGAFGGSSGSEKFAEWFDNTSPGEVPLLCFPYAVTINAIMVAYNDSAGIRIGAGEACTIELGTITQGDSPMGADFNVVSDTSGTIVWDDTIPFDSFPVTTNTGLSIALPAGTLFGIRSTETGTVTQSTGDLNLSIWYTV